MEQEKIIDLQKILYPEEYKTMYVFTYPTFNDELRDLIDKSGYKKNFKTKYHKGLRFLENLKESCIQSKGFECLVKSDEIYSMILHGNKNIRILFDFQEYEGTQKAILYTCFHEKETKDYSTSIKIVKSRRRELFNN